MRGQNAGLHSLVRWLVLQNKKAQRQVVDLMDALKNAGGSGAGMQYQSQLEHYGLSLLKEGAPLRWLSGATW
jgi:hypothetical protein